MRETCSRLPLPVGIKKWGFETQRRSVGWKEDERDIQSRGGTIIAAL